MDNKYSRGKIYKITSKQTDNVYIGSTIQTLNRRFQGHMCDIKRGKNPTSKCILQYGDAIITLIEEYPCNSMKELHTRERYHIENTQNTVNKEIPTRSVQEYYENNRKEIGIRHTKYRKNNPEKVKLTQKNWYQNNIEQIRATRLFQISWGGDRRYENNLLQIDPKLFEK